jgi:hypothetical protein
VSQVDSSAGGGVGFAGLLAIVFIVLKLCKVIDWNWFWVLSPLWIGTALAVIVLAVAGLIFMVAFATRR